jgi:hypothetical protein
VDREKCHQNGDSSEKSCEAWLLDSASSFHVTLKELFSSYIEKENGFAYLEMV